MKIIKYYANMVAICIGTSFFGWGIISSGRNVLNRLVIFSNDLDRTIGLAFMVLSLIKLISLFLPYRSLRKFSLLGIFTLWLLVTWAYLHNPISNTGYYMSGLIAALCFLELWRGDFSA